MSKIAIIADLHFGVRNDNPFLLAKQEAFFTEQFFPYIVENDITEILIAGDIFDKRKNINISTIHRVNGFFFEPIVRMNLKINVLLGNHDTYYRNTNRVNSFEQVIVDKLNVKKYLLAKDEIVHVRDDIIMVPWLTEENSEKILADLAASNAKVVFGHFEINGFEMTKGMKCEHGLNAALFRRFKNVYSGHFHLKSSSSNITYLGTPYEMDWNDTGSPKGFYILDTDTLDMTYEQNFDLTFVKLPFDGDDYEVPDMKNCYVRLIVSDGADVTKTQIEKMQAKISAMYPADLLVVENKGAVTILEDGSEIPVEIETKETSVMIAEVLADIETDGVDKDALVELMKEIYLEAAKRA